jgi:anti-anti-sigma factor
MNPDQATFERADRDGYRTLTVSGELDLLTAPRFLKELEAVTAEAHSPANLDLSAVSFMDSSGLEALLRTRRSVDGTDVSLVLVNPSPCVRRVLEATSTDALFEIVEAQTSRGEAPDL